MEGVCEEAEWDDCRFYDIEFVKDFTSYNVDPDTNEIYYDPGTLQTQARIITDEEKNLCEVLVLGNIDDADSYINTEIEFKF